MKKWLTAFIATALLLTACEKENETKQNSFDSLNVDKGIANVDVTMPVSFFIELTKEELIAEAKKNGITEIVFSEDGLVTYTMSKSKYKEAMEELENAILSTIDKIVNSGDYTSIKEISYNKEFTEFNVKVNRQQYKEEVDGFVMLELIIFGACYSAFDGKSEEDLQIIFNVIDETTGEIYDTAIYPDDWQSNRILTY